MVDTKKILIIRGWRSKKEHWQKTKEAFETRGFEVLMPALPGVSEEGERIEKPWSIDDYKKWLFNFTENKRWNNFNLLGHSFGGAVSVKFSACYPEKVEKLILCSPAIVGIKSLRSISIFIIAQIIKIFFRLPFLRKFFPKIKKRLSRGRFRDYYFEGGVMRKTLSNLSKEKYENLLKKIRAKTLIIWGEKDDRISVKYSKRIKNDIKDARLIIFPLVKHNPHREKPEEFVSEIIKFLGLNQ